MNPDAYMEPSQMPKQNKATKKFWRPGLVVGTLHTAGGLPLLARPPRGVEALEARLDAVAQAEWSKILPAAKVPVILTPRDKEEGGSREWSTTERSRIVRELLPWAAAVDLELAHANRFGPLRSELRRRHIPLILSTHDFTKTPSARVLARRQAEAAQAGAAVFKVAVWLQTPQDLKPLLDLLAEPSPIPVAAMGMGPWGSASRVFLARAGSVLNYGWLHRPQVPGQLPAARLARVLREIGAPVTPEKQE
jgi:3-dehydroquinate dehydratase-1